MPSILIVDDDDELRQVLRLILEQEKYLIAEAVNGKVAREMLTTRNFSLIISDISMPHLTGIELLEWVNLYKSIPVILTTGFADIIETQEASQKGAAGFLAKPFKDAEIVQLVNKILKPPKVKGGPVNFDDLYCKVSITDFAVGKQIPFAVSIRLSSSKYIKVAHRGENIDLEKIKAYQQRGINYLYVKKEDYAHVVGFNLKLVRAMQDTDLVSLEKKKAFLRYTGEVVLEQAFTLGIDEKSFRSAKEFVENSIAILAEDDDTFSLLMTLNSHSDYQYAHALGVSTISVMVTRALGWDSPVNIFKISLAGLFHDIGKKEIDKEILEKPRHLLTLKERSLLETHPLRGKDILESLRTMPQDIIQVAYEHHEDCLGHGFPRRLKKGEIHPFARLIYLTDLFCNYTIKGPSNDPMRAAEAISKIEIYHRDEVDETMFKALCSLVFQEKF